MKNFICQTVVNSITTITTTTTTKTKTTTRIIQIMNNNNNYQTINLKRGHKAICNNNERRQS